MVASHHVSVATNYNVDFMARRDELPPAPFEMMRPKLFSLTNTSANTLYLQDLQ